MVFHYYNLIHSLLYERHSCHTTTLDVHGVSADIGWRH